MKTAFFVLIFILSQALSSYTFAVAQPPQFVGHFAFTGKLSTLNTLKKEVVRTSFLQGQQRLKELKNIGFTCKLVQSTIYSCAKNTHDSIPLDVAQKLSQALQKNHIEFSPPIGDWEIINKTDYLREFSLLQKTQVTTSTGEAQLFTRSRYLVTDHVQKLILESDQHTSLWLNVYRNELNSSFKMPLNTQKTLSDSRFEVYLVEADFALTPRP